MANEISNLVQRGTVVIPKSSSVDRIKQNFQGLSSAADFPPPQASFVANITFVVSSLSREDFASIDQITVRDPSKLNRFVDFDAVWGVTQFGRSDG